MQINILRPNQTVKQLEQYISLPDLNFTLTRACPKGLQLFVAIEVVSPAVCPSIRTNNAVCGLDQGINHCNN